MEMKLTSSLEETVCKKEEVTKKRMLANESPHACRSFVRLRVTGFCERRSERFLRVEYRRESVRVDRQDDLFRF